jgi:hypothetical protein
MQYKIVAYLEFIARKWGEDIIRPILFPIKEALKANQIKTI